MPAGPGPMHRSGCGASASATIVQPAAPRPSRSHLALCASAASWSASHCAAVGSSWAEVACMLLLMETSGGAGFGRDRGEYAREAGSLGDAPGDEGEQTCAAVVGLAVELASDALEEQVEGVKERHLGGEEERRLGCGDGD